MTEYCVEFEITNPLTHKLETKTDFVHGENEQQAIDKITWKYGEVIGIITVEEW